MKNSLSNMEGWAEQKVFAADGLPDAWLGYAVAIHGKTAFVGARNMAVDGVIGQGVVYVYNRVAGGWKEIQRLVAPDGTQGDQFGTSIALEGSNAIVTAPYAKIDGKIWQGAAYFFHLANGRWVFGQKLTGARLGPFDTFGTLVSMNSSRAFFACGGANRGGTVVPYRVLVFDYDPSRLRRVWQERATINTPIPEDPTSGFGTAISVVKDTAVIGARGATIDGVPGQGAAYVYRRRSSSQWVMDRRLMAVDGGARENFGVSVAYTGTEILVGAQGAVIDGRVSQGAVYRFVLSSNVWKETQKIVASDGSAINLFGASLSQKGNHCLVGAYAVAQYRGAAYLFVLKQGQWRERKILKASDRASGDLFGYYTTLSDNCALVGAWGAAIAGNPGQGAAYFISLPPPNAKLDATPVTSIRGVG